MRVHLPRSSGKAPPARAASTKPLSPALSARTAGIPLGTESHAETAGAVLPDGLFTRPSAPLTLSSADHPAEERATSRAHAVTATAGQSTADRPSSPSSSLPVALREPGSSLSPAQRRTFEPRFHFDFAKVRIHTSPAAEQAAEAVHARAFTLGPHLVFNRGQYMPHSATGNDLLAHELGHIVENATAMGSPPVLRRQTQPGPPPATPSQGDALASADPKKDAKDTAEKQRLLEIGDILQQIIGPLPLLALGDAANLKVLGRLAWELLHQGLFGPVMDEAIAAHLLPPVPNDFSQRTALQVRWFLAVNEPEKAFFYLNGLAMIDLVDVLRLIPRTTLDRLASTFGEGSETRAAIVKNYSEAGLTRFQTALDAVRGQPAAAGYTELPEDQQQTVLGLRDLQQWLTLLPRARRDKKQKQGITPNRDRKTAMTDPVVLPEGFDRAPGKAPEAEQSAVVELIRRNRQRLTNRIAASERSATGFSHGGSLSKDARPSSLPALGTDDASKTRTQLVDEAMHAELGSEGSAASVNTFDGALLTWGHGLANGGALSDYVLKLFASDPDFKTEMAAAGVTFGPDPLVAAPLPAPPPMKGNKQQAKPKPDPSTVPHWFAVNTEQGVVEQDDQALQLLRLDPQVQSLYIVLAESQQHKQKVADAQWSTIKKLPAFGFTEAVRDNWPLETIRGCAHFIHWGNAASWKMFEASPRLTASRRPEYRAALHAMVDHLFARNSFLIKLPNNSIMIRASGKGGNRPSQTMLNFVDKFAIKNGIVVPVTTNDQPDSIYFDFFDVASIPANKPKQYFKLT